MEKLERKVREVIINELGHRLPLEAALAAVGPTTRLMEDLGADSLDHVELVMAVEEEFGVEVSDEDADTWVTVGDVEAWVRTRYCPGCDNRGYVSPHGGRADSEPCPDCGGALASR